MKRWLWVPVALVLVGCGDDEEAPGITAIYADPAATVLTPYPSNRYTVADPDTATGLRVSIGATGTPDLVTTLPDTLAELEEMDGFSTTGGVIVMFDGPIDATGIALGADDDDVSVRDTALYQTPDSPFLLLDVDPESPEVGQTIGLVPRWWEQAKDGYYVSDEFTLIAQPAVPLRPATRYLFVVTDALRSRTGGPVSRSPLSEELLDGSLADAYAAEVGAGLGVLETSLGVSRDRVALATSFTTASMLDGIVGMSELARASGPPALSAPWSVETDPQPDGRVRFRAVYDAPEYRRPPPDGHWEMGADGKPVVQETVGLEVFLAMTNAQGSEPRVPVIYGHGLGGDKDGCWGTAERLSELNVAVFAIDSPWHGSRSRPDSDSGTWIFDFFGLSIIEQAFVIGRARDNFRQMASDQLELVKLIGSLGALDILPPGAPDGIPDLDLGHLLYIGHSFGSVQGPTIFALAPEITQAVWNVGGAGAMGILRDSHTFGLLVMALRPDGVADGAVARFMAVTQAIVDPGDPLDYGRYATLEALPGVADWKPRDVLLQEVVNDAIVPNTTSRALARATGLELADALEPVNGVTEADAPRSGNLPLGNTGVMSQFDHYTTDEGVKTAQHGGLIFSPEGSAQYVDFFASGLAAEHGTVPPAYP
jgi:hypothetical protein